MFFTKNDTYTKNNHCPKRTGHVMNNKMLFGAKQFSDLLSHCTLLFLGRTLFWFDIVIVGLLYGPHTT